jgi:hypothetical protein
MEAIEPLDFSEFLKTAEECDEPPQQAEQAMLLPRHSDSLTVRFDLTGLEMDQDQCLDIATISGRRRDGLDE